jgi:hypothetical protein
MSTSPISLPLEIVHSFKPGFNGPTAWLLASASSCAKNRYSKAQRDLWSRMCCVAAVATAALELLVHATLFLTTVGMIAVRRCIWMTLVSSSYVLGGLFYIVHGGAFALGWETWLRRIAIYGILLLRDPSVVWDHLFVWRGSMLEHASLIMQLSSLALKIEGQLVRRFSSKHLKHHGMQAFQLFRYVLAGIPAGLWNPGIASNRAMALGLGATKPRALVVRLWNQLPSPKSIIGAVIAQSLMFIGAYWDKLGLLLLAAGAYRNFDPSYIKDLPTMILDGPILAMGKVLSACWRVISPAPRQLISHEDFERLLEAIKGARWF